MRVTQSMLTVNTLRHITGGYDRLGKIQDQLASGKKITRASQDPVVAMNGMRYRSQVVEVEQFKRNLGEVYNWMDNADSTLDKTTNAIHRIRELAVQASNDTYESTQRANMAKEIDQLLQHIVGMANTKSNGKFIFNGTNTTKEPVNLDLLNERIDMDFSKIGEYSAADTLKNLEISYGGTVYAFDNMNSDPASNLYVFKSGTNTITVSDYGQPSQEIVFERSSDTKTLQASAVTVDSGTKVDFEGKEFTYETGSNPEVYKNGRETITIDAGIIKYNNGGTVLKESDVIISDKTVLSQNHENVKVELLKGVTIDVNIRPQNVYNTALFADIKRLINLLEDPTTRSEDITKAMDVFDKHIDNFVSERAELGARVNRVEMIESRLMEQEVIAKRIMSNNEDADMEKVIIDLMQQESVHRAALSAGARIMQPTLMDFLR